MKTSYMALSLVVTFLLTGIPALAQAPNSSIQDAICTKGRRLAFRDRVRFVEYETCESMERKLRSITFQIFDQTTGDVLQLGKVFHSSITEVLLSPDETKLLVDPMYEPMTVFHTGSGSVIGEYNVPGVEHIFSPDNRRVLSVSRYSDERGLYLVDLQEGQVFKVDTLGMQSDYHRGYFSPDGQSLFVHLRDSKNDFYPGYVLRLKDFQRIDLGFEHALFYGFSSDSKWCLASRGLADVALVNVQTGKVTTIFDPRDYESAMEYAYLDSASFNGNNTVILYVIVASHSGGTSRIERKVIDMEGIEQVLQLAN